MFPGIDIRADSWMTPSMRGMGSPTCRTATAICGAKTSCRTSTRSTTSADMFSLRTTDWVVFGVFGTGWQPLPRVGVKAQLDAHSNFYTSALDELGASAIQASVGGWWETDSGRTLTFAFSEDLIVKSAPDFTIHIGLGWTF